MISLTGTRVAATPLFDPLKYGLIWVPDQARDRCDQGIVKYVGPEVENCRLGDHILFSGYTGTLLDLEGEGLMVLLPEEYIVATIAYNGPEVAATTIPGLYFKDLDGTYFEATYERVMEFVNRGLEAAEWYRELKETVHIKPAKILTQRPKGDLKR